MNKIANYFKKTFMVLVFVAPFIITNNSNAQSGIHIGANGGLNSTYIINQNGWSKYNLDYSITLRKSYGILLAYNLNENIGFQTELNFLEVGQKYHGKVGNIEVKRNLHIKQMQIPLLLKISNKNSNKRTYMLIGPAFGLNQKQTETLNIINVNTTDEDVTRKFNDRDTQILFEVGGGIFLTKRLYVNVGFRGAMSLYNINSTDWKIPNKNGKTASYNAYTGLSFGCQYYIPLTKY